RYMKAPPITSSRIREYSRDRVMITVNDHEFGGKKNQTMSMDAFMDGLLISIHAKGFQIVRRSGLFANTQRKKLGQAGESLERDFKETYRNVADPKCIVEKEQKTHRERQKKKTGVDPLVCVCGKNKVMMGMMHTGQKLTTWVLAREATTVGEYCLAVLWINDS
ncbi:MAG: transposase, partial [Candidatus Margulisiibacteriota bacterium]